MSALPAYLALELPRTHHLRWNRSQDDRWCDLDRLNLDHAHFDQVGGVYVIWYGGPNGHVVRVGQGEIRACLKAHRTDPDLEPYRHLGLIVSWAVVDGPSRDGVERYLAEAYRPLVGHPLSTDAAPITVNLVGD
ncbi:MAG: hypothetical protein K0Q76_2961 [Panacagrimonas sp.]|jgi:hypothetical protein|nr:hypothetical protein [Panacagrimonas sp.]MCC2657853.1 hypothetical protein [Panacagrimonas sp.]